MVILDSLVNSNFEAIKRISNYRKNSINMDFIKGDILDEKLLNDIFQTYKSKGESIDSVIHFAALKLLKILLNLH